MTEEDSSDRRQRGELAPTDTDRLPTHSPEDEQGALGCILLDPKTAMPDCIEADGDVFYDLTHRTLYQSLVKMERDGQEIDMITLLQRLRDGGQLDSVGGMAYVATLPDAREIPAASAGMQPKRRVEPAHTSRTAGQPHGGPAHLFCRSNAKAINPPTRSATRPRLRKYKDQQGGRFSA